MVECGEDRYLAHAECLPLNMQSFAKEHVGSITKGIHSVWFKACLEGEDCTIAVPLDQTEHTVIEYVAITYPGADNLGTLTSHLDDDARKGFQEEVRALWSEFQCVAKEEGFTFCPHPSPLATAYGVAVLFPATEWDEAKVRRLCKASYAYNDRLARLMGPRETAHGGNGLDDADTGI